jgi:hypothetical protein
MQRLLTCLILTLISTFVVVPASKAETFTFSCGGSATYSVTMPQGLLTEGNKCTGDIVIDSKVKIIGSEAFYQSGITSVAIPLSVTGIGSTAFAGTKLVSLIIPNSVTAIGHGAFFGTQLKTVVVGDSVAIIDGKAFSTRYLESITLPDGLKVLGEGAIPFTDSLTSIIYCGELTGFPIKPTCPAERRASLDKKANSKTFTGCPSTWNLRLPNIQMEYTGSNPVAKRITFIGDNRAVANFDNPLKNYYPDLSSYLESQGQSVKSKLSIEISDQQSFSEKISDSEHLLQIWFHARNQVNYRDAEYGVPLNPWVRLNLKIEVKGCKAFSMNSNSVQYKGNYQPEDIEEYFSSVDGSAFYDSKQQELLRSALKKNYIELSKPETLRPLLFGGRNRYLWRTSDDSSLNPQTDYKLVALAPMNCLKRSANQNSLKEITFNSTPCRVGVFLSDWETGEHLVQIIDFKQPMTSNTVITCIKGKLTQKITTAAVKPACPNGWKKK